jgi:hypothetical protein
MQPFQYDLHVFPGQAKGLSPEPMNTALSVMVGLVPTIHVFTSSMLCGVQDVDARHKGEYDGPEQRHGHGFRALRCAKPRNDSAFPLP